MAALMQGGRTATVRIRFDYFVSQISYLYAGVWFGQAHPNLVHHR
jgi:hypothetical protein